MQLLCQNMKHRRRQKEAACHVSQKLSSATVLLEGLLDALVICALPDDTRPEQNMNFRCKNAFYDPRLGEIQNSVKALQTFRKSLLIYKLVKLSAKVDEKLLSTGKFRN